MKRAPQPGPDWAAILADVEAKVKDRAVIADAMGLTMLSDRMMRWFRNGGEPSPSRGNGLIELWIKVTKKKRDKLPMKGQP